MYITTSKNATFTKQKDTTPKLNLYMENKMKRILKGIKAEKIWETRRKNTVKGNDPTFAKQPRGKNKC